MVASACQETWGVSLPWDLLSQMLSRNNDPEMI